MMFLEKGFNLLHWSRVKLILMEFSHIISHRIAIRVDDKVLAKIVHKLLIMLAHDFSRLRGQVPTIPIDNLWSLQVKILLDLLNDVFCDGIKPTLHPRPIPCAIPWDETPKHQPIRLKLAGALIYSDRIGLLIQNILHFHEGFMHR